METGKPGAIDFSRGEWGCDERVRFLGTKEIEPPKFLALDKLIVHHTVTPEDYDDAIAEVRALYTYHTRILGWGDIGYHVLIDRLGRAYEGRHGRGDHAGREVLSADVVGAHTSSHNFGTCSVALIGQFHGEDAQALPQPMLDKLVDVLEHLARQSYIDPQGASDFLRSNGEWNRGMPNIAGHRDCNTTSCPGDNAYALMEEVRSRLASRLAMQPAPRVDVRQGPANSLTFEWTGPAGADYSYYLQGWSEQDGKVDYLAGFGPELRPAWSGWTKSRSMSYSGLPEGHWTLNVRARSVLGASYKATRSVEIGPGFQVHL